MGPALGGLLIWGARLRRAILFPRHPGEYLLVVEGMIALLSLETGFLAPLLIEVLDQYDEPPIVFVSFLGVLLVSFHLAGVLVWYFAGRWIGTGAWGMFFFLCAGAQLLGSCNCGALSFLVVGHCELDLLISPIPVVLAVKEHRRGLRYPWTHWLGVGIWLWFALLNVPWFLFSLLWFAGYW
jgi:hypothetical protein